MVNFIQEKRSAEELMVPKTKSVNIFKKLLYQTKKGNIDWSELDKGIYIVDVSNFNLRVNEDQLFIYDLAGDLIATLKNNDLAHENDNIKSLFQCARQSSLKVFEKLNELEKALDGIL